MTASKDVTIPEVLAAIVELSERLGVRNIKDLPGCWEVHVDKQWWFAMNGHGEPTVAGETRGHGPYTVPPYSVVVDYNGWPAGVIDFRGGVIADGTLANEDAFIAALRAHEPEAPA